VYSSNANDLDHRHISQVPVAGGTPSAVTNGPTIADLPVFTSDGNSIAFLSADAKNPMRPVIVAAAPAQSSDRVAAPRDIAPQTLPED
jgi:Tol biopolymer transport system component